MTACARTYDDIAENIERLADHRPVNDYALALAGIRAQVAIANELAALRVVLEGAATSLERLSFSPPLHNGHNGRVP